MTISQAVIETVMHSYCDAVRKRIAVADCIHCESRSLRVITSVLDATDFWNSGKILVCFGTQCNHCKEIEYRSWFHEPIFSKGEGKNG